MKTKIFTLAEVRKCEEEAFRRGARHATNQTINAMLACTAHTLMDKMEFTPAQLREFMERNNELYGAVNTGYVSFEDLKRDCEEEYGIEFREE